MAPAPTPSRSGPLPAPETHAAGVGGLAGWRVGGGAGVQTNRPATIVISPATPTHPTPPHPVRPFPFPFPFPNPHQRPNPVFEPYVLRWPQAHDTPVMAMDFDSTGAFLATGASDSGVRVWDVAKGFCTHSFRGHKGVISCVRFHPDANRWTLFTASDNGEIRVWDLLARACTAVLASHVSSVRSLDLSPDGYSLLSAGRDQVLTLWNLRTNAVEKTLPIFEVSPFPVPVTMRRLCSVLGAQRPGAATWRGAIADGRGRLFRAVGAGRNEAQEGCGRRRRRGRAQDPGRHRRRQGCVTIYDSLESGAVLNVLNRLRRMHAKQGTCGCGTWRRARSSVSKRIGTPASLSSPTSTPCTWCGRA